MAEQLTNTDIASTTELVISEDLHLSGIIRTRPGITARTDEFVSTINVITKHISDCRYRSLRGLSNEANGVPSASL